MAPAHTIDNWLELPTKIDSILEEDVEQILIL